VSQPRSPAPETPSGPSPAGDDGGGSQRPAEFRRYRRFVTLLALAIITLGAGYLLVSVGVTIYRQRYAVPAGKPVSETVSQAELQGCWQELNDVFQSLQKHLEKSHYLLSGYDQQEAQRWASEGLFWQNQWKLLGERCRLAWPGTVRRSKAFSEMVGTYQELANAAGDYTKELLRFGREQAPRLDRVRQRIERIGRRLERQPVPTGEHVP